MRKGFNQSIAIVVAVVVVVALILILGLLQTNQFDMLENFGVSSIEGAFK